jgi:hypothetical protein
VQSGVTDRKDADDRLRDVSNTLDQNIKRKSFILSYLHRHRPGEV